MKHLLVTLFLLLQTLFAFGQITINAGDLPVIGLEIEQGIDTMPESNLQPGGTGQGVWDFSDLEDHVVNSLFIKSPQGLPFANQYPTATLAIDQGNDFYQYAKVSAQSLQILGNAGNFQINDTTFFNLSVAMTPPLTVLNFPATYNQMFDQDIRQVIQFPVGLFFDSIRIISNVHRDVKIDAYGMLTTPDGIYNTLRVKVHAANRDSTFGYTGSAWLLLDASTVPDTSVNFAWWGMINGYAFPVVELEMAPDDFDHHVLSATWVKNISTGTNDQQTLEGWSLYPNPASEVVYFEWPEDMTGGRLEVYDLQGRLVLEKNISDQPEKVNLHSLRSNLYVFVIKNEAGRISGVKTLQIR